MDQLPELVKCALFSACNSGKSLSWKVQENKQGILIQLVWKSEPERCSASGSTTRVGSIWKSQLRKSEPCNSDTGKTNGVHSNRISNVDCNSVTVSCNAGKISRKKKISPSRARRNARRLQAFLERKRSPTLDSHVVQKELDSTISVSQDNNVVQESNVDQDEDLKSFLDKEVSCVDFSINKGETGLTLDLNSGESMWTPVHVLKPSNGTDFEKTDSVLSAEELSDLDGIEFLSHASNDAPGVVLMKGSLRVWTPVAARTRSRLKTSVLSKN